MPNQGKKITSRIDKFTLVPSFPDIFFLIEDPEKDEFGQKQMIKRLPGNNDGEAQTKQTCS
jgi:hypothetical protein